MILDNVDDADFLVNAQAIIQSQSNDSDRQTLRSLQDYLPQSQNESILITTRSRELALKLLERNDLISIDPMDASNAVELLNKKLESTGQSNDKNHIELAAALEFMPLAIVQATTYISQRASRYSVRQYLEDFRKSDRRKTGLLNHVGGQLRRDWEAKNSIIITWQISFEHIHRTWPSAADLLSLMSFFDRQGIPEALVRDRARVESGPGTREERRPDDEQGNGNEDGSGGDGDGDNDDDGDGEGNGDRDSISEAGQDDRFEEDVQILRDYSFISLSADGTFEMHALVRLATRRWLEAYGHFEQWKQHYIHNLAAGFPTGDYENWTTCRALFPHAKAAIAQRPQAEESLREWASLLYNAASYAWRKGSFTEAIDMSRAALDVQTKILGQEHEATLSGMGLVGLVYNLGGQWDKAEELEVQVMKTMKRLLGKEHLDTLTSIANLASTYTRQGRWKEAEELQLQVMEIRKRVLGKEHPSTLASIANLASTYWDQGRWKEAEELQVQVMEATKRVLGKEHLDTLTSIANFASTYRNQGRWKEAEELQVQVMEATKRVLGKEHPDTLTSIANLASTYWNQGRWKEAEELQVQVMEATKRVLGKEHPDTLTSIANLALTYQDQGRWKEAEELDIQVMKTRKRVLGKKHPDTLSSMSNLAFTLKSQIRYKEAISLMENCFELQKRILGPQHPETEFSLQALHEWKSEADEHEQ